MGRKAALHNLGCKVNAYETEAMRQLLEKEGYEIVPFAPGADVYVINTCTVTNIADRKSRQMLHRARKMNPDAIIVAAGCYVETAEQPVELDPAIDIVLGNNRKGELLEALRRFEEQRAAHEEEQKERGSHDAGSGTAQGSSANSGVSDGGQDASERTYIIEETPPQKLQNTVPPESRGGMEEILSQNTVSPESRGILEETHPRNPQENQALIDRIDINHTKEYESLFITQSEERTRACIKVQDGCNQFCSYCIIPFARGRVRSREIDDVLREARTLAANGCQEVVLTGIHLSSYGVDCDLTLLDLIRAVHEIPGIRRIRLGSLEPGIITEEFARSIAQLPKFCPHFHLSLQSGCTETLRRMNRRYTAEEFAAKCELLRQVFDRPAITTDVIAGFPGETEEEFETTVAFLTQLRLYETHIFKYSRRHGTRAAVMPDQIPESVKAERSDRLIALGECNRSLFEQQYLGDTVDVLFEERITVDGRDYYTGYTKQYIRVAVPADADYENQILTGTLGEAFAPHLYLLQR